MWKITFKKEKVAKIKVFYQLRSVDDNITSIFNQFGKNKGAIKSTSGQQLEKRISNNGLHF